MASAKITYAPELRESEHGRRLYRYWKIVRHETDSQDFVAYPDFFKWAMANGYTIGAKLFRYDIEEPYSSENCFWVPRGEQGEGAKDEIRSPEPEPKPKAKTRKPKPQPEARNPEREREWDEVVNRIRVHFGMEPIYSSEV